MKRNSFLLYTDSMDIISELSDAQAGRLLRAMVLYQKHLDDPTNMEYEEFVSDSIVKIAFSPVKNQFDRDYEKYKDVCSKRANAGRKGGLSKSLGVSSIKAEPLSPVKTLIDIEKELMSDELWKEQMCRQSGIGAVNFMKIIQEQIKKFFEYISATGSEKTVLTKDDAKRRFFWWWTNTGVDAYNKCRDNGKQRTTDKNSVKSKPDIQSRKSDEERYTGSF